MKIESAQDDFEPKTFDEFFYFDHVNVGSCYRLKVQCLTCSLQPVTFNLPLFLSLQGVL
jgi:hypothetical protein